METITSATVNLLNKTTSSFNFNPQSSGADKLSKSILPNINDVSSLRQILTYLVLPAVLAAYPVLTSLLRFRRVRRLHRQYHYPTRESLSQMTDGEAWEIQKEIAQLEFPFIFTKALQFALFRTYGIPSISHTLTKTSQFSDPKTSFKRYADTSLLVTELLARDPSSDRARAAIARTNYIHSGYRTSGAIREEDMLYTLSLFATEPIRFIDTYEWRKLTDLEKCALGTFWKSMGDAMGISYAPLPSCQAGGGGFKDGLHWLDELSTWSRDYEAKAMVPDQKNRETADQTTAILVYILPETLKHIGLKFVSYMMDDRLRRAMLYDPPPPIYATIFSFLLHLRKFLLRYLALPRPYFLRHQVITEEPDPQTGAFYQTHWDADPYYVKPTIWNRWLSPGAVVSRFLGLPLPGDEGEKYFPGGYEISDVGPRAFRGRGKEFMDRQKEILRKDRTGGCPFH